jgi:anti-sigma-K factor RskA
MTEHSWKDLAASYALGALDRVESAEFERHLETCPECRAEVQSFQEVAARLVQGATPATPPPELRERVLREAHRVRPLPVRRVVLPWAPAAAAAVVLALIGGYGYWRASDNARDARALRDSLAVARAERDSTQQVLAAVLDSTVATAHLAATGKPPSLRLYWNRASNVVVVAAFDLPPAPRGRSYQLWAIRKGRAPVSIGVFNSSPTGRAIVTLRMPPDVQPEASALTEEPFRGSPQPTQQPFLIGTWRLE